MTEICSTIHRSTKMITCHHPVLRFRPQLSVNQWSTTLRLVVSHRDFFPVSWKDLSGQSDNADIILVEIPSRSWVMVCTVLSNARSSGFLCLHVLSKHGDTHIRRKPKFVEFRGCTTLHSVGSYTAHTVGFALGTLQYWSNSMSGSYRNCESVYLVPSPKRKI